MKLTVELAIISTVTENQNSAGVSSAVIEPMLVEILEDKVN